MQISELLAVIPTVMYLQLTSDQKGRLSFHVGIVHKSDHIHL